MKRLDGDSSKPFLHIVNGMRKFVNASLNLCTINA